MNQPNQIPVQLEDLYRMIGEREVIRYYQQKELDRLMAEVDRLQQLVSASSETAK
jgi:hypothetical protein